MEIKSLYCTGFDTLFKAFSRAFVDYEMQVNELQLQAMLTRRGYLPKLSFEALDVNELVAFTLNELDYSVTYRQHTYEKSKHYRRSLKNVLLPMVLWFCLETTI